MSTLKFTVFIAIICLLQASALAIKKPYIVYLGVHSHDHGLNLAELDQRVADSHHQFLGSFLGSSEKARDAIVYSYKRHINGFAAILEVEDATNIAKHPDVVSVFLDRGRELHTTNSWNFLNLEKNGFIHRSSLWKQARFGEDVIIAHLDTGVWPESKSFSDEGYGPIPARWNGKCHNKTGVPCNKKLIGARYFNKAFHNYVGRINSSMNSARDTVGHGTHTLSTAGGNFVAGARVFSFANGTAKGGSPRARVATYKVCWPPVNLSGECFDADIMKGFDSAIHDRVDVLSVSLGGSPSKYFDDGIAIGAFHAVKNGIVVVCSAGNSGPDEGSVTNVAPWIITVGASTIDREFSADVLLNTGDRLKGESLSKPMPDDKFYPLINAADAKAANSSTNEAKLCKAGTLNPDKVKGKILVCLRGDIARIEKSENAYIAGAVGMILCNDKANGNDIAADPHILPASHISYHDGLAVYAYLNSTKDPTGYITPPYSQLGKKPAPVMADFSSKGPNKITPEILKPDITAPGVNIIAAFSEAQSASGVNTTTTSFNILSGTSMSCPHVSGVVGLLKKLHPDWSAAAIRSAIMTTARTRDNSLNPMRDSFKVKATPFSYGAGHIRPNRAMDPGLVYDLSINDYLDFLCGSGYNSTLLGKFSEGPYECPKHFSLLNFNYPSITVPFSNLHSTVTVSRTLKNVGTPGTYAVRVRQPRGVSVSVQPSTLTFDESDEEKSFKLTLELSKTSRVKKDSAFGELLWSDGKHYVRSPIVVAAAPAERL